MAKLSTLLVATCAAAIVCLTVVEGTCKKDSYVKKPGDECFGNYTDVASEQPNCSLSYVLQGLHVGWQQPHEHQLPADVHDHAGTCWQKCSDLRNFPQSKFKGKPALQRIPESHRKCIPAFPHHRPSLRWHDNCCARCALKAHPLPNLGSLTDARLSSLQIISTTAPDTAQSTQHR